VDVDDELECPGCGELVDVRRPLGVELQALTEPSMTSPPGAARLVLGGDVVHDCDARSGDRDRDD
jgi:hypothetical protein